eukprot:gene19231-22991_t
MTSKKDIEEVENEIFHRNHPGYPGNHRRYRGKAGDYRRVNALLSLIAQQSLKSEPIQAAESVKTAELCLKTAEIHQSVVKDTPGKFDAVAETLKHNTDTTRFQLTELQAEMSAIKENT